MTSELHFTLLPGNHCNRFETHDTPIQGQVLDDAAATKDFCESINESKFLSCMKKKLNYGKLNCIRATNEFVSFFPGSDKKKKKKKKKNENRKRTDTHKQSNR